MYAVLTSFLIFLAFYFSFITKQKSYYYTITRIHLVIEFLLLAAIFYLSIVNKVIKKLIFLFGILFTTYCTYDYLTSVPSLGVGLYPFEYFLLILFIISLFIEKLSSETEDPIYKTFIFWLSIAFLINASGNIFLFIYSKSVVIKDAEYVKNNTIIYDSVTIMKDILLCIGAAMKGNARKPNTLINREHSASPDFDYSLNNLN